MDTIPDKDEVTSSNLVGPIEVNSGGIRAESTSAPAASHVAEKPENHTNIGLTGSGNGCGRTYLVDCAVCGISYHIKQLKAGVDRHVCAKCRSIMAVKARSDSSKSFIFLTIRNQSTVIPLNHGQRTIIDLGDCELVTDRRWQLSTFGYAVHRRRLPGQSRSKISFLHRLITNAPPELEVDHINGNKLDNRRCNLRLVTKSQNAQNRHNRPKAASGYRGVHASKGKYCAVVVVGGKPFYFGHFADPKLASAAAIAGRKKLMTHAPECETQFASLPLPAKGERGRNV